MGIFRKSVWNCNIRGYIENATRVPRRTCYSFPMAVKAIQLGQVWRNDENGRDFLVTKLYSELFTQYAMLRPADASAADADTIRIKVAKTAEGVNLPGYTFTQDLQDF